MINLPHDWMRVQHKSCFVHEPHCCAQGERGEGGENLRPPRQKKRNRQDKSEPRKKLPVANKWNVFFSKKWVLVFMRLPEPPGISSNSPPPSEKFLRTPMQVLLYFLQEGFGFYLKCGVQRDGTMLNSRGNLGRIHARQQARVLKD